MSLNDYPKQFWSSVKSRTRNPSAPSYSEYRTQRVYPTVSKTDLLNVFFTSVFNDKHEELPCQDSNFSFTNCVIDDLVCTENNVLYINNNNNKFFIYTVKKKSHQHKSWY